MEINSTELRAATSKRIHVATSNQNEFSPSPTNTKEKKDNFKPQLENTMVETTKSPENKGDSSSNAHSNICSNTETTNPNQSEDITIDSKKKRTISSNFQASTNTKITETHHSELIHDDFNRNHDKSNSNDGFCDPSPSDFNENGPHEKDTVNSEWKTVSYVRAMGSIFALLVNH